jgi:hypothetical protein
VLYIVLALVLAAFGLLIAALTTAETLWAWISVVVSVAAAALLVMDWVNGRRRARTDEPNRPSVVTVGGSRQRHEPVEPDAPYEGDLLADDFPPPAPEPELEFEPLAPVRGVDAEPEATPDAVRTVVTEAVEPPADPVDDYPDPVDDYPRADYAEEPGEEPTDASDLLVVAGLNVEVRVVDEHPRYHLATCVWLANRPTIPIPVAEARQLGFTPCARCGPDGVLAARHRAAR